MGRRLTRYLLDADISLYELKGHPEVRQRFLAEEGKLCTSALVHSQLLQGAKADANIILAIAELARIAPIMPYDEAASYAYSRIVDALGFSRALVMDRMIAAHAISLDAVLVTNNLRDFAGIPGLDVENWTEA